MKVVSIIYAIILMLLAPAYLLGIDLGPTSHVYVWNDFLVPAIFFITAVIVITGPFNWSRKKRAIKAVVILMLVATSWIQIRKFIQSSHDSVPYFIFSSIVIIIQIAINVYLVRKISIAHSAMVRQIHTTAE